MKKIVMTFAMVLMVFFTETTDAQVGIGTMTPDKTAALDVTWDSIANLTTPLGTLIPRMTETQRDKIVNPANGLLIFNTDEECINAWSVDDNAWSSVCGGTGKSQFTLTSYCDSIFVFGNYLRNTAMNGSNYLSIPVNVTKTGTYSITGTASNAGADNGYGFAAQGTFVSTGYQIILAMAQGKPDRISPAGSPDIVSFMLNGVDYTGCTVSIDVHNPAANYDFSCGTAKFNGVYVKGAPLTTSNTVEFNVNVKDTENGTTWSVSSNTVNGISFAGAGAFPDNFRGSTTITLQGNGTPVSTDPITVTFTNNSSGGVVTCTATVTPAIPPMTVLALGTDASFDYPLFYNNGEPGYLMVTDPKNFGVQPNSTVKFGKDPNQTGWIIDSHSGLSNTPDQIATYLNTTSTPPDIVIISYLFSTVASPNLGNALYSYLQKGGVALLFLETNTMGSFPQSIMSAIYPGVRVQDVSIATGIAGARYQFPPMAGDPIIDGPFGNLGGQFWGEDASVTMSFIGLPSTVTVYTSDNGSVGGVTMFKDNNMNLFAVGDGGFNSDALSAAAITTYCPFWVSTSAPYVPLPKPVAYGNATSAAIYGYGPVSNSICTANVLAWALNRALYYGINPH